MSVPSSTVPPRGTPKRRSRRPSRPSRHLNAWIWALGVLWLALLALPLGALHAIGDTPPAQASPFVPAPWMPVFTPIA